MEIEKLTELPVPPPKLPECDLRYVGLYYSQRHGWIADGFRTLEAAAEQIKICSVPGSGRILEVPQRG